MMSRYSLVTFGCQMNQHDSERVEELLGLAGYTRVLDPQQADVVLLNTCSVREKAEQKLRSEVGRLALLKKARPNLALCVLGCVAQQEGERLLKKMPQLDLVVGPDHIAELPELIANLELGGPPRVRVGFDLEAPRFLPALPARSAARASAVSRFVTIMKGCNERCSFCIVPHTRGAERYRPSAEIVQEIAALVASGAREITLLGQTVNSYRDPSGALPEAPGAGENPFKNTKFEQAREDESEFAALLRAIAASVPALLRLRYTSPHPRHLTNSLIRAHAELPVLARHVHMPVQSGSDRVLKRMIRRYSVAEYCERIARLRDTLPGLTLSTDVIVGFPGESPEDFAATLDLVRSVGFVGLFGFKYSVRPYTPAQKLADDIPESEKAARLQRLFEVAEALRQMHLNGLVGGVEQVLVEECDADGNATGRSGRNEIVHFAANRELAGEVVSVRITRANKNSLGGEPLEPSMLCAKPPVRAAGPRALPVLA
ncbi:MAG TPA: MiaB/RimO family radical SAM methylthiotransferase [Polyangiaceae bacterium]|nr:MiaB/RimO family radical SAM methylthiotransferase [Polyangiaceae bacterium]